MDYVDGRMDEYDKVGEDVWKYKGMWEDYISDEPILLCVWNESKMP